MNVDDCWTMYKAAWDAGDQTGQLAAADAFRECGLDDVADTVKWLTGNSQVHFWPLDDGSHKVYIPFIPDFKGWNEGWGTAADFPAVVRLVAQWRSQLLKFLSV